MRLDERLDAVVMTTNSKMKLGKMQAMILALLSQIKDALHLFPPW